MRFLLMTISMLAASGVTDDLEQWAAAKSRDREVETAEPMTLLQKSSLFAELLGREISTQRDPRQSQRKGPLQLPRGNMTKLTSKEAQDRFERHQPFVTEHRRLLPEREGRRLFTNCMTTSMGDYVCGTSSAPTALGAKIPAFARIEIFGDLSGVASIRDIIDITPGTLVADWHDVEPFSAKVEFQVDEGSIEEFSVLAAGDEYAVQDVVLTSVGTRGSAFNNLRKRAPGYKAVKGSLVPNASTTRYAAIGITSAANVDTLCGGEKYFTANLMPSGVLSRWSNLKSTIDAIKDLPGYETTVNFIRKTCGLRSLLERSAERPRPIATRRLLAPEHHEVELSAYMFEFGFYEVTVDVTGGSFTKGSVTHDGGAFSYNEAAYNFQCLFYCTAPPCFQVCSGWVDTSQIHPSVVFQWESLTGTPTIPPTFYYPSDSTYSYSTGGLTHIPVSTGHWFDLNFTVPLPYALVTATEPDHANSMLLEGGTITL